MNELETESQTTRAEAATYLRELADQLDAGGSVGLDFGGQQATMGPTEPITLKLEAESDRSTDTAEAKERIEVELIWWRGAEPTDAASE